MQTSFKENNDFFKRIMQIIEYKKIKSVNDFAINWLNYDAPQKINRLKDPSKKPSYEIILDIVNKFEDINPDWLLTGKEPMLRTHINVPNPNPGEVEKRLLELLNEKDLKIQELKKALSATNYYGNLAAEPVEKLKKGK